MAGLFGSDESEPLPEAEPAFDPAGYMESMRAMSRRLALAQDQALAMQTRLEKERAEHRQLQDEYEVLARVIDCIAERATQHIKPVAEANRDVQHDVAKIRVRIPEVNIMLEVTGLSIWSYRHSLSDDIDRASAELTHNLRGTIREAIIDAVKPMAAVVDSSFSQRMQHLAAQQRKYEKNKSVEGIYAKAMRNAEIDDAMNNLLAKKNTVVSELANWTPPTVKPAPTVEPAPTDLLKHLVNKYLRK